MDGRIDGCLYLIISQSTEPSIHTFTTTAVPNKNETAPTRPDKMGKASLKAKEKLDAVLNNPNRNDSSGRLHFHLQPSSNDTRIALPLSDRHSTVVLKEKKLS